MFRVQDNVPEVYINESRDFQLISRLYDVLFSGVKYDIDSMVNLLDATLVKDSMLQLMCSKVGFFPRVDIDANVLKHIVASFPYILKYKGSFKGIQYAVNAILKAESDFTTVGVPYIDVHRKKISENDTLQEYTVYIYTTVSLYNKQALDEVLRYVIPTGMHYQILQYNRAFDGAKHPTILSQHDAVKAALVYPARAGAIKAYQDDYKDASDDSYFNDVIGAFDTQQIVSSYDLECSVNQEDGGYTSHASTFDASVEGVIINQTPQVNSRRGDDYND